MDESLTSRQKLFRFGGGLLAAILLVGFNILLSIYASATVVTIFSPILITLAISALGVTASAFGFSLRANPLRRIQPESNPTSFPFVAINEPDMVVRKIVETTTVIDTDGDTVTKSKTILNFASAKGSISPSSELPEADAGMNKPICHSAPW